MNYLDKVMYTISVIFVTMMVLAMVALFVGCDGPANTCPPEGYEIIFDGTKFGWSTPVNGYIHPVLFDNPVHALLNCIRVANGRKDNIDRYQRAWVVIDCGREQKP